MPPIFGGGVWGVEVRAYGKRGLPLMLFTLPFVTSQTCVQVDEPPATVPKPFDRLRANENRPYRYLHA